MDPVSIAILVREGLKILKVAKETFYPDKAMKEAQLLLKQEMAGNVQSLQAQVQAHRQIMDRLVEQVSADKELIEKHNEILIHLSEAADQTTLTLARLRMFTYLSAGLAALSILGVAILAKLK